MSRLKKLREARVKENLSRNFVRRYKYTAAINALREFMDAINALAFSPTQPPGAVERIQQATEQANKILVKCNPAK